MVVVPLVGATDREAFVLAGCTKYVGTLWYGMDGRRSQQTPYQKRAGNPGQSESNRHRPLPLPLRNILRAVHLGDFHDAFAGEFVPHRAGLSRGFVV